VIMDVGLPDIDGHEAWPAPGSVDARLS